MDRSKKNIMAALLSALVVVLSAVAAAPLSGAWLGRNPGDAQVSGTVTDSNNGQPLGMVNVTVSNLSDAISNLTDSDGKYLIIVPPGDYTISFTAPGYGVKSQPLSLADSEDRVVDASLAPLPSEVKGTVSSGGSPVEGATVLLIESDNESQLNTSTNATGDFRLDLPGYGLTYTLRITAGGMYGFTDTFALPLGAVKTEDVNLTLIPGASSTVWGYVFDSSSSLPIDGARVTFTLRGSGHFAGAVAAAGGFYEVSLAPGFYDVLVEAPGYLSFVSTMADSVTEEQEFTLSPKPAAGTVVSGQVTSSATALPIAGAVASLIDSSGARNPATTDSNGGYSITTYAGCFTLEVVADGYFAQDEPLVVGNTNITKDVALLPVPALTVMVWGYTKDVTATPVDGVTVTLFDLNASHSGYITVVRSAIGGHYSIMTYPGHFLLVGEADGYAISAVDLPLAKTQRQDILLNTLAAQTVDESMTFSDWSNITYTSQVLARNTGGATRWEIDHNFGNGDGTATQAEVDGYLATLQERGPQRRDTKGYLTVDAAIFKYVDGTYAVTAGNAPGPDTDTTPISLTYTYNLTANATVPAAAYHVLSLNQSYSNAESTIKSTFGLPYAFEMRKVVQATANMSVNGTSNVTVTPVVQLPGAEARSEWVILNISKNEPPFADTSGNQTVKPGGLVTLDGSTSSDDVAVVNWTWDFADGAFGYGAVVTHTYNVSNGTTTNFTVNLTITDTGGLRNSTTLVVTVDGKDPVASFTHGNLTVVEDIEPFEVNATTSSDDVKIARYFVTWGDFSTSEAPLENAVTNHTYSQPGTYNVTLNVTDLAGNWANKTVAVTVLDNTSPVARFIANVTVQAAGLPVEFNGTTSEDNVGVTMWVWDFGDNSSKVSGNVTQASVVNHTYGGEGTPRQFNVTLNVSDGLFWNATTITVTIQEPRIYADLILQDLGFSKKDPVDGDKVQISVKIANRGEKAATNFTVRFMDGTKKVRDVTVKSLEVNATKTLTVDWIPKEGKHTIKVIADPPSAVAESNKTNNEASANMTVKPNQMIWYIAAGAVVAVIAIVGIFLYAKKRAARRDEEEDEEEEEEEDEDEEEGEGEEEDEEEEEERECPKCFAEVGANDKKCPSCGANLRR